MKLKASYESVKLKPAKAQHKHPIRNLRSSFDFDAKGNIGFIQHESGKTSTFLLVDTLGKILATIPLEVGQPKDSDWDGVAFVGGNEFVTTLSDAGVDGKAKAWRIATKANGLKLWTIQESYENYPKTLFSPASLCVGDTGEVLVLDNIKKQVQVFTPNGIFDRNIDLKDAWGREPNYPSEIASAPDHEILVFDFDGSPLMVMMHPFATRVTLLNRCRLARMATCL